MKISCAVLMPALLMATALPVLVFSQSIPNATLFETNSFLDVSFRKGNAFIDDVQIHEIRLNSKNIQAVAIDSIRELPLRIAIAIDTSGSRRGDMNIVREFFAKMIQSLPLRVIDSACLISFNHKIAMVQGMTTDKALLLSGFDRLIYGGGTRLLDAIFYSTTAFSNQGDSRRAMIIITDGMERDSDLQIKEAYKAAIANNIRIYMFIKDREEANGASLLKSWQSLDPRKHKDYVVRTGGKFFSSANFKYGQDHVRQMIDELNHLKRIKLSATTPENQKSALGISVTRNGVKPYYPSALK